MAATERERDRSGMSGVNDSVDGSVLPAQDTGRGIAQPPARSRAYAQARRNSTRVRWLKKAIPIGAGLAIGIVATIGFLDPFRHIGAISIGPINLAGTRITMEQPRLTGFRGKDGQPFEVTADSATQDVRKPNVVDLVNMRARVTMQDGAVARLQADHGLYDTQQERIDLKGNVRVVTDSGYSAKLRSAFVDFRGGVVTSSEPVEVAFSEGTIAADRMDITDNGRRMVFEGRVHTVFEAPGQAGTRPAARKDVQ